jgi:CHAT domain-containing protein
MIVADPVYGPEDARRPDSAATTNIVDSLPRLPAAGREAAAIAAAWPGRTLTLQGLDARRERVLQLSADRFDVLHFATHVTLNRINPDLSRIELSRYDTQGRAPSVAIGPRDFREIKLSADLVVLSGCDSGLGLDLGGEGMLGLQQSLIGAGARNVIATLWSVSDRASLTLMTQMYQQLGESAISYRRVLRDAQLRMRRSADQSAPYHWAAFGLYSTCLRC